MSLVSYRDCACAAAFMLGLSDLKGTLDDGGDLTAENVKRDAQMLIECVNLAVDAITDSFIPLVKTERLHSCGGVIFFKDFGHAPNIIFSVKNAGAASVFKRRHDRIETGFDGEAEVTYSFKPLKGGYDALLPWDADNVGARIVAYGAACEYALIEERHEDAAIFDRRFKDALDGINLPRHEVKIKRRRWL